MQQRLVMLAVILHVVLTSSVYAHHSHFYDQCRSITIEGRVERVEFKNPHNLITLRVDDGTPYIVDWINLTRLTNAGIIGAAKTGSGIWSTRRGDGLSNKERGRDTAVSPEVQGRCGSEYPRGTLGTARGRQFQLGAVAECIHSELRQ